MRDNLNRLQKSYAYPQTDALTSTTRRALPTNVYKKNKKKQNDTLPVQQLFPPAPAPPLRPSCPHFFLLSTPVAFELVVVHLVHLDVWHV